MARMKKQKNIDGLVSALTHPRPTVRWTATRILGELWDIPLLVDLGHRDHNCRTQATKSLKESKDLRITGPLIATLWDPYQYYSYDQGWWYYPVRVGALKALCNIGAPETIEPILRAIRKRFWTPMDGSLSACLAQMGEPILMPLIALLSDRDRQMQHKAVRALGALGNPQAIEPLDQALRNEKDTFKDKFLKENIMFLKADIIYALYKIGGEQIIPIFDTTLKYEEDRWVQSEIVDSLSKIQNPDIIPVLKSALQRADKGERRMWMIDDIVRHGTPEALRAVEEFKQGDKSSLSLAEVSEDDAIQLIEAGNLPAGRAMLEQLLEQDEVNEQAWLWLSKAVDDTDAHIICLENVLAINPNNAEAYNRLKELDALPEQKEVEIPPTQDISQPAVASEREMKE